jgi:hypothetical protein
VALFFLYLIAAIFLFLAYQSYKKLSDLKMQASAIPGLESRFGYHLYFPDYSPSELLAILDKTLIQAQANRIIKMSSPTKEDYVVLTERDFQEGLLRSSIS